MILPSTSASLRTSDAPRLVATDLDGTFLSPDGTVSEHNAEAVRLAQQAGVPVVFATGRPVRWLEVVSELPGAHPMVIVSNGAALYDLGSGTVLDRICLDPDVALAAVGRVRKAVPGTTFAFEEGTRFAYEPAYRSRIPAVGNDPRLTTGPAEEIVHWQPYVKMLIQHRELSADELLVRVRDHLGPELTGTHSVATGYGLVEVSAAGVNKATMLQRYCERLGIEAADVAAFGDMPNDLDMLTWAGRPHIVANAHPALLEIGYEVVPSNAHSGVGRTVLGWLGASTVVA